MKRYVHTIDVVFVLVLFCVFSMSLLFVLMTGARVYKDIKTSLEGQYTSQTCINYLSAKLRHYNDGNSIEISEIDGIPALCLSDTFEGVEYNTYVYYKDGYVRELLAGPDFEADSDAGDTIIEVDSFSFGQVDDELIYVEYTSEDGKTLSVYLNIYNGEVLST